MGLKTKVAYIYGISCFITCVYCITFCYNMFCYMYTLYNILNQGKHTHILNIYLFHVVSIQNSF